MIGIEREEGWGRDNDVGEEITKGGGGRKYFVFIWRGGGRKEGGNATSQYL